MNINKTFSPRLLKSLRKNIICNLCEVRFTQRKALYVHLRKKHDVEPLKKKQGTVQCSECKNMFYDKYNLKRHCRRAHGSSPVSEGKIQFLRGRRAVDTNRRPKFIQEIEENYSRNCKIYEVSSSNLSFRNNEKSSEVNTNITNAIICAMCHGTFTSKSNLIRHINEFHFCDRNLKCVECNEKFQDKRALLQHTHSLMKYRCLEDILPNVQNYKYEVIQCVQLSETCFVAEIYCNLTSREDANKWFDKFQQKNKVTFRKMRRQCQSSDGSYVFIVDRYRCQHNTLPKRRSTPHAKHTGCSATLFIRVYQHKNFLQLSWSRIRIKHTHNHLTDAAAKFRDPVEEVVNKFQLMFQAGKGPKAALNEHMRDLQLLYGDDVFADRGICPTSRWVYNFYRKMTRQCFESFENTEKYKSKENPVEAEYRVNKDTGKVQKSLTSSRAIFNDHVSSQNTYRKNKCNNFKFSNYQTSQEVLNNSQFVVSSINLEASLDKYLGHSDSSIDKNNMKNEYKSAHTNYATVPLVANFTNTNVISPVLSVSDKFHKHPIECVTRTLQNFNDVMNQVRFRVATDPMYFLNAMRNFINTYPTLENATSLSAALFNFGKYSDFEINEL